MYDILIQNGNIIDGTGKSAYKADIGISNGKIVDIGNDLQAKKNTRVINAKDLYVTPGFIDIQNHSDSYWTIFDQPEQKSMLAQGITTIVLGNCGASLAPISNPETLKTFQKWHTLSGININWVSFSEMLDVLGRIQKGVNVASLVGHATLRRGLVGDQPRHAKPEELAIMESLLVVALNEGAMGMSMGLVYSHEVDSTTDELIKLSAHLKKSNKYLSVHLRSEAGGILDAVDEAVDLAGKCQVPVKISHLKVRDKKNWQYFDRIINKLETAYHQGLDVTFDVYPYSSSWSVMYPYLPRWAYEGGRAQIINHLTNPTDRRKIADYLKEQQHDFTKIIVATAEDNPVFVGKSITEIAANQGVSGEEALMNVIVATKAQVIGFDHNLDDEMVEMLISSPLSIVASDGAGYSQSSRQLVHPRCYGTMPAFLRMVRDKKLMKWEQAIKKITTEPARLLGLKNRGQIAEDYAADLVLFDPKTIADLATYEHPFRYPNGISTVLVNGAVAWTKQSELEGTHGQVIRR